MRSKQELEKLLIDLKGWFKKELDHDYDPSQLEEAFLFLIRRRYSEFLRKRIDHLPDADLINFWKIFIQDSQSPIFVVSEPRAPEVKKEEPVKKEEVSGQKKVTARKNSL